MSLPITREFQALAKAKGITEFTFSQMEGFISARFLVEALQRAGSNPTRSAFINATWELRRMDLGGFEINASAPERSASRFVELTLIGRDGRFIR